MLKSKVVYAEFYLEGEEQFDALQNGDYFLLKSEVDRGGSSVCIKLNRSTYKYLMSNTPTETNPQTQVIKLSFAE